MNKSIIFVSHCEDHLVSNYGGLKLLNSFRYFHPDLQLIHLGTSQMNEIYRKNPWSCLHSFMPLTMKYVMDKYNCDHVCHLDYDSLVLSRLDEILEFDYDVASVRNNADNFTNDERHNRPNPIKNIQNHLYCNAGCVSANRQFIEDWAEFNKKSTEEHGSIYKAYTLVEQDTMNILAYSGKFKFKILDPIQGNLHYGASANTHSPNNHPVPELIKNEYNVSSWSSWYDIEYKNDKFYMYNKQVKLLHMAGGGGKICKKLDWIMFKPEIVEVLKKITNYD